MAKRIDAYELAVRHAVAVLDDGRAIVCKTRGRLGVVRMQLATMADGGRGRTEYAGVDITIRGGVFFQNHRYARAAAEHFIQLVGLVQGAEAVRKAALDGDGADGRFHTFTKGLQLFSSFNSDGSSDTLSFDRMSYQGREQWIFIKRYGVIGGTAKGGADCVGTDLEAALSDWEQREARKVEQAVEG